MNPEAARAIRTRGVGLATAGLFLALAVGGVLQSIGPFPFHPERWLLAAGATLAVQSLVWALVRFGWADQLPWDRHFVLTPMLAASLLLVFFVYLSPELRELVLMVWLVTPLFVAGLAGFAELAVLSVAMSAGYLVAIRLRIAQGVSLDFAREVQLAIALLLMGLFSGVVLARLKRERQEMKRLRRELAQLALTDALTGLPNRRHFEEVLRGELDRVVRYGGSCAVAIVDVDHFKSFNDRCGHPAGDAALRELAALMRASLRASDLAARIGGEEFGLIMVATEKAPAAAVVERLRQVVEQRDLAAGDAGRLTISAGLAACPTDAADFESLFALADHALYRAKEGGRNRVCLAPVGDRPLPQQPAAPTA
jgi:diguanylate cyclase (GGDEF)-like protein